QSDDDEYALRVGNHRELSKLQTAPEELVLRTLSRCVEIFQRSQPSQHISRWGNLVCRGAVATGRIRALLRKGEAFHHFARRQSPHTENGRARRGARLKRGNFCDALCSDRRNIRPLPGELHRARNVNADARKKWRVRIALRSGVKQRISVGIPRYPRISPGPLLGRQVGSIIAFMDRGARTVTRLLSELRKKELIRLEGSTLVIRNRIALEALAA